MKTLVLLVAVLASPAFAQTSSSLEHHQDRSERIGGAIGVSYLGMLGGGLAGALVGGIILAALPLNSGDVDTTFERMFIGASIGAAILSPFGVALAVALWESAQSATGEDGLSVFGALLGAGLAVGASLAIYGLQGGSGPFNRPDAAIGIGAALGLTLPNLFSILCYELSAGEPLMAQPYVAPVADGALLGVRGTI